MDSLPCQDMGKNLQNEPQRRILSLNFSSKTAISPFFRTSSQQRLECYQSRILHSSCSYPKEALAKAGLKAGVKYGVWPEIYLQYEIDDTQIDYHFDFIIAPILKDVRLKDLGISYGASKEELDELEQSAKTGKNLKGNINDRVITVAPDLTAPIGLTLHTS
ncbi:MAG: hypothetical protein LH613_18035 [Chamaesiphon sp.]|nr:hypothetical protein [Chamaesiphon sp.]